MLHHQLKPYMGLPDNYKLGYKVTRYKNFQHYSCVLGSTINKKWSGLGIPYYHYKWSYPNQNNKAGLCCFRNYIGAVNFYEQMEFHKPYRQKNGIRYYIVPCVYILSTNQHQWDSSYLLRNTYGGVFADKIMLVGDLIIPKIVKENW